MRGPRRLLREEGGRLLGRGGLSAKGCWGTRSIALPTCSSFPFPPEPYWSNDPSVFDSEKEKKSLCDNFLLNRTFDNDDNDFYS